MRTWWSTMQRWLTRRSRPEGSAQAGLPDAAFCNAHWCLAWASRAGPHHGNQDCAGARVLYTPDGTCLAAAVADGVTQAAAGEVAARSLVQYWLGGVPPTEPSQRTAWLAAAETQVAGTLQALTPEPGGATGAAFWLAPDGLGWCTRIGDCRVLRAQQVAGTGWQVQPLMPDQTLARSHPELYPDPLHPDAQQPAHFAGCGRLGEPEWEHLALGPGDLLLLASDGLHAALAADDWQHVLSRHLGPAGAAHPASLGLPQWQALLNDLIQTAHWLGSEDDITVLVVAHNHTGRVP